MFFDVEPTKCRWCGKVEYHTEDDAKMASRYSENYQYRYYECPYDKTKFHLTTRKNNVSADKKKIKW